MSKFNYDFSLAGFDGSTAEYTCENINARLDFINENCVRVALYKKGDTILPTFLVCPDNEMPLTGRDKLSVEGLSLSNAELKKGENKDVFTLGDCEITLNKHNFLLSYSKNGKKMFCDREPLAYNFSKEFGNESFHYISRAENEKIYGLGDKGGEMNKAGRSFKIETTDCMGFDAASTDPLYKHVPFFMCENENGNYGIFYDTSDTSYFDFGKEINNYYEPYKYFKTEDNALVYYVFFGSKLEILQRFSNLCGKQAFPPKWSFDYCASTMAYTDAEKSEEHMNEFLNTLKNLDFSCKGFYLSSGYTSIGNQRFVFNWNTDKFPNPQKFIENFKDNNIYIIPNIKPAFLTDHPMYSDIAKKGLFIKNPDGTPFLTRFWDGEGSYLDFTNPEAFDFWAGQVDDKILSKGIIATWNDNNEYDVKDPEAIAVGFGNGEVKASRIRATETYLMVASSNSAQIKREPNLRPFLSSRSSNPAIRRLAQTWSGDNRTEFCDLRYCNNIGLTMSLSGLQFYGHDLGGFTGNMPSPELLLRWLQLGLFQPRFTVHSWNKDGSATMPWSYPETVPSVRKLFKQRKQLTPYLYNCAYNAVEYNIPINAPLFLYYDGESDKSDSFMLGRDILVTCIFDEGVDTVSVHLPKGDDWYLNGKYFVGGSDTRLNIPYLGEMPYAVRAGSVIPTDEGEYGFESEERLVFTVYPKKQGTFESDFFDDDGVGYGYLKNDCVKLHFAVTCNENEVAVSFENLGKVEITPEIRLCKEDTRKLIIK